MFLTPAVYDVLGAAARALVHDATNGAMDQDGIVVVVAAWVEVKSSPNKGPSPDLTQRNLQAHTIL